MASPLVLPQLRSSLPPPPRLMLATSISLGVRGDVVDAADDGREGAAALASLRTRTGQIRAPGAIPTTPVVVVEGADRAGDVGAVAVAVVGAAAPVEQFFAPAVYTFRSGWSRSTPVSMTATSTFDALVGAVDPGRRAEVGVRAVDAGGRGLGGGVDDAVALDEEHPRVVGDLRGCRRAHVCRVALEGRAVEVPDLGVVAAAVLVGDVLCGGAVLQDDDVGRGAVRSGGWCGVRCEGG